MIVAILTALVAPLVVDWSRYRSAFEDEASRLSGFNVHVNGAIDARILPTPLLKLRSVEAGVTGQEPRLRADTIALELSLGSLLRGEFKASEVHVIAPQVSVGLGRSGVIDWPAVSPSFETLSISRLNVEQGRIVFTDAASGSQLLLHDVAFDGDVRSLSGPFK